MTAEWRPQAIRTILALSQEQTDHIKAALEWETTHKVDRHVDTVADCELCGQPRLKTRFETRNKHSGKTLWIGSNCTEKFITVLDADGNATAHEEKGKRLRQIQHDDRAEKCMIPLRSLYEKVNEERKREIASMVEEGDKEAFGPLDLLGLFREMKAHHIDYPASSYKVNLRTKFDKQSAYRMSDADWSMILPALSSTQQKAFEKNKAEYFAELERKRELEKQREEQKRRERAEREKRWAEQRALGPGAHSPISMPASSPNYYQAKRKYTVAYYNKHDELLEYAYRPSEDASRRSIKMRAPNIVGCAYAEIQLTECKTVVARYQNNAI